MSKSQAATSKATATKATAPREKINESAFAFGKENFILLFISIGLLFIGYMLMSGGKAESPEVFNPDVFSSRRITIAPLVVMAGYALAIWAIVKKAK